MLDTAQVFSPLAWYAHSFKGLCHFTVSRMLQRNVGEFIEFECTMITFELGNFKTHFKHTPFQLLIRTKYLIKILGNQ